MPKVKARAKGKAVGRLGEALLRAMEKKNYSVMKTAKLAAVSYRHLLSVLQGSNVSIEILIRLARTLDMTEVPLSEAAIGTVSLSGVPPEAVLVMLEDVGRNLKAASESLGEVQQYLDAQRAAAGREATALVHEVTQTARKKKAEVEAVKKKA